VAVARVSTDEAALDERREGSAQGLAAQAEEPGERDEATASLPVELGQNRHRPAVVEERDEG
jgi:hypothetical protein